MFLTSSSLFELYDKTIKKVIMSKFKVEIEKILDRGVCPFGFKAGGSFEYEDRLWE